MTEQAASAIFLIRCADRKGIVARAVRKHVERRVLVYGRKTVVFD